MNLAFARNRLDTTMAANDTLFANESKGATELTEDAVAATT